MTMIHVPRPPQSAMDPERAVSSLLRTQIDHMHEAERKLPASYQTGIYVNAIRTEGEAADYIRAVTEAIHRAHDEADRKRNRRKRERTFAIAAAAEKSSRARSTTKNKSSKKKKPKK